MSFGGGNQRNFNRSTLIGNDDCEVTTRDRENEKISDYLLNRLPISAGRSMGEVGIYPTVSSKQFSSAYRPDALDDTSKASKLLQSRLVPTTPYMGAGRTQVINPDLDTSLTRGQVGSNKREYNPAPLKSSTYRPMPMIPSLEREVQNVDHIVPTYWTRGGMDTRGQLKERSQRQ